MTFKLIGISSTLFAQISVPDIPESFLIKTKGKILIPDTLLQAIDTAKLVAETKASGIDNRYGVVQQINIDLKKQGTKTLIPGKGYIWQFQLHSSGTYSLGVRFSKFCLPLGAKVFIYDEQKSKILGAFTSLNNNERNQLTIADLKGKNAIIEYFEPFNPEFEGSLVVGSVTQSFVDLTSTVLGRIGINCPEGANWQDHKHAVCRMTFDDYVYSYFCTGFLVNNVRQDGTPYFMTANHCISTDYEASTLITYFNYENSTCSDSDAVEKYTLSGATLKASNSYSDFTLLQLREYPPKSYSPFFSGWDVSIRNPKSSVCIHHPSGEPKCIATDNDAPVSYDRSILWDNNVQSAVNTHWEVQFDSGTTEGGSSGSPLFDDNKRVIGQLHGGSGNKNFYGKFSTSWDHSSLVSQSLNSWLDPDNTGTTALDGDYMRIKPLSAFSAAYKEVCTNTAISFKNESTRSPQAYTWKITPDSYSFVNGTTCTSKNPQIEFTEPGSYKVTLISSNSYGSDTLVKTDYITAKNDIKVTLSGYPSNHVICGCDLNSYPLVASGAMSYSFDVERADKMNNKQDADTLFLSLLSSERKYGSFSSWVKVDGIFGTCQASDSVQLQIHMPVNDDIENAKQIWPGNNGTFSNECASVQTNEPQPSRSSCYSSDSWCPSTSLSHSIWFTFWGPSSEKVTINTGLLNNRIAVYEADSCSDILSGNSSKYSIIGANDDRSANDATAFLKDLPVKFGKKYWIQLDGDDSTSIGNCRIDLLSNSLEVFPNPSTGLVDVIIANPNPGTADFRIFNLQGKILYQNTLNVTEEANRFQIDLSYLAAGVYFLHAILNGTEMVKKIVILNH
ncbi:MAG: T9SS type A sorting domain-containing protein [Bacteroidota bacterium]|nr:T9SS type A sorting domain-containing protein [Bacteroidota bacterium]